MLAWALTAMLAMGATTALLVEWRQTRQEARKPYCVARFHPGLTLAAPLLADVFMRYRDQAGSRKTSLMTAHSVYGPDPASPRYVAGFCHYQDKLILLRVEQIDAMRLLDSGETYRKPADALRALMLRAPASHRIVGLSEARRRKAG